MGNRPAILLLAAAMTAGGCGDGSGSGLGPGTAPSPEATTPGPTPSTSETASIPLGPELRAAADLIGRQQTDSARARLQPFIEAHPDDGKAAFLMGLTYHREKRYALALPWFESAVALEPAYHPTYHFHGWCLYYLGDMQGARAAFDRHLAFLPAEGDSHFALGLIALDDDRLDDARQRFRRAIELQQNNPRRARDVSKAHARLADVHIRRDELEAARDELRFATALWPQHYTAFYKLSRVLNRLGDNEAADEAFRLYRKWEARAEKPRGVPERAP